MDVLGRITVRNQSRSILIERLDCLHGSFEGTAMSTLEYAFAGNTLATPRLSWRTGGLRTMKIQVAITALALAVVLSVAARGQNCDMKLPPTRGGCQPPRPHPVTGLIADKYNQIGGANGILGPATKDEQPASFGGTFPRIRPRCYFLSPEYRRSRGTRRHFGSLDAAGTHGVWLPNHR